MTRWLAITAALTLALCPGTPGGEGSAALPLLQHRPGLHLEPEPAGDLQPGYVRRGGQYASGAGEPAFAHWSVVCLQHPRNAHQHSGPEPAPPAGQQRGGQYAGADRAGRSKLVATPAGLVELVGPEPPRLQPEQRVQCRVDGLESDPGGKDLLAQLGDSVPGGPRAEHRQPCRLSRPISRACARWCRSLSSGSAVCPRSASGCSAV